eukprot:Lithocolla_globosa_v1_NODE_2070_length_2181_cov_95.244591.p2 type:complete len:114 gc:universal NODE_2070_length_2181_cov_95.244591:1498-1157(-)
MRKMQGKVNTLNCFKKKLVNSRILWSFRKNNWLTQSVVSLQEQSEVNKPSNLQRLNWKPLKLLVVVSTNKTKETAWLSLVPMVLLREESKKRLLNAWPPLVLCLVFVIFTLSC